MQQIIVKGKKEINRDRLCALIISLFLFSEICLNGAPLYILVPCVLLLYIRKKIYFNAWAIRMVCWLFVVCIYESILGIVIQNNDISFSFVYNTIVFISVILSLLILLERKRSDLFKLLEKIVLYTFVLSTIYIVSSEVDMLISRWSEFLKGTTGYRLGISSNINPNLIAWLYGYIAVVSIFIAFKKKIYYMYGIYFLSVVMIVFTGSKNGLLCAALPLGYWGLKAFFRLKIKQMFMIAIAVVLFMFLVKNVPVFYTLIGRRLEQFLLLFTAGDVIIDDASTNVRLDMFETAIQMFKERPILGWGIGAFAKYGGYGYYSHNNYAEILVSGGIIFFTLYYGFVLGVFVKLLVSKMNLYVELAILIIASNLMTDIGAVSFYSRYLNYLKIVLVIILIINEREKKIERK